MIEEIKKLYKEEITAKTDFIISVAEEFKMSPLTLRNFWFSKFWSIPKPKQAKVLEMIKNKIRVQNDQVV